MTIRNSSDLRCLLLFLSFSAASTGSVFAADWPCYRGPNMNGTTSERITRWPPKELWRANVGQGYAGVAVSQGRVYAFGWAGGADTLYCFSETSVGTDPTPLWTASYPCGSVDFQGTRGTPAVDGNEVYTFSHQGRLSCFSTATGTPLWSTNLNTTGRNGSWGYASSPIIEGNLVIVNVGRRGTALNRTTHAVVWGNDNGYAGFGSPQALTIGTQRTVVVQACIWTSGINPANGTVIWSNSLGNTLNSCDPIIANNQIWMKAGYSGNGSTRLANLGSGLLTNVWTLTTDSGENCRVLHNGYIYGPTSSGFHCMRFSDGTVMWTSDLFGMESAVTLAGDELVIVAGSTGGGNGDIVVAAATPAGYQELRRTNDVVAGQTWTAPTLANGRLYIRSQSGTLICYDVNGDKDNDGMADDWETQHLPQGTNTVATDSDNDNYPNLWEYVAGTDPTNPNSRLRMDLQFVNGKILVSYPSLRAAGTGYAVWSRFYDLETKTNLLSGAWQPVPGATNVPGADAPVVFTNSVPADNSFYRVKVRLD